MEPALRRVLLVEDNPDVRMVAKSALEMVGGLEVRACASGAEALEALAGFAPQMLLLDVMMPDMDGPGVLNLLRERPEGARLPVVFLTAKTARAEVERLRGLGALDVLTKPFDPMTLHDRVKAIWERTRGGGA